MNKDFFFNPITHEYFLDGVKIPSVTSFIPYTGFGKKSDMVKGSLLHNEIESYVKKQSVETEMQSMFDKWYSIIKHRFGEISLCEVPMYMELKLSKSKSVYIAGKIDYYFSKGFLVDFKSSTGAGDSYYQAQLGAYKELLKQNGYKVKKTFILYPQTNFLALKEISPNLNLFKQHVKDKLNG